MSKDNPFPSLCHNYPKRFWAKQGFTSVFANELRLPTTWAYHVVNRFFSSESMETKLKVWVEVVANSWKYTFELKRYECYIWWSSETELTNFEQYPAWRSCPIQKHTMKISIERRCQITGGVKGIPSPLVMIKLLFTVYVQWTLTLYTRKEELSHYNVLQS